MRNLNSRPEELRLSKRRLGEAYITGSGAVLGGLLVGLVTNGGVPVAIFLLGLSSVCALVTLSYWFRRLDLSNEQVWHATECGALVTGVFALLLVGAQLTSQLVAVSPTVTVGLVVAIAVSTTGGALVGVAHELRRSTRQLSLRNDVFYRVLRHHLRNDMTVVLARLDEVKSSVDEPDRQKLETAERKIDTLLALTDNVCQVNGSREHRSLDTVDVASVVRQRVTGLRQAHPDIDLTTDLPETARIETHGRIGLVVDTLVESAIRYSTDCPALRIEGFVDGEEFVVHVEDEGGTIPEADLSALAAGGCELVTGGRGVEMWLVHWLAERGGGQLTVETEATPRWIELRFDQTESRDSWL